MSQPPWFKRDSKHTATGYRWLDLLTDPYWRVTMWLTARRFWKLMAVNESWRQARNRTQQFFRDHPEFLEEKR